MTMAGLMENGKKWSALPYGLMRLDRVINFEVRSLVNLIAELELQDGMLLSIESGGVRFSEQPDDLVNDDVREHMRGWVGKVARIVADSFEWDAVNDRIDRFVRQLDNSRFSNRDLSFEIRALKDAIEDGLKNQYIYRYPSEKAAVLKTWKTDWEPVTQAFPASEADIVAGVDLWALGHGTASVFHMMRVLEYGLTGLANHLGKPFGTQMWHSIISQIESAIGNEQKKPKSAAKQVRLQFLSEAAKELRYFKDGWRNYVAHNKCEYDSYQARGVMEHTRQFMMTLAEHLSDEDVAISNRERDQRP